LTAKIFHNHHLSLIGAFNLSGLKRFPFDWSQVLKNADEFFCSLGPDDPCEFEER
jgi:hypothetical protein